MSSEMKQYFFFKLNDDIYAIDASFVNEMVEYQAFTKVPMMASYVRGVTNIRGHIISVIDLQERLGLGKATIGKKSSLVIVDKIALIIDEVHEVNSIETTELKSALNFGFKIEPQFVHNMAQYEGQYIAILNLDEVLNISEISLPREKK